MGVIKSFVLMVMAVTVAPILKVLRLFETMSGNKIYVKIHDKFGVSDKFEYELTKGNSDKGMQEGTDNGTGGS